MRNTSTLTRLFFMKKSVNFRLMKHSKILLILALGISLFGCSKSSDRDDDTTINSSLDYAFGQSVVYDAFKIVHQAANSSKGIASINMLDTNSLFGCDTLIVDTTTNPMSITIEFNSVCSGNGIERTGSITALFSSKYDALGCLVGITFNNYTYKGYPVNTGTVSYSYTGLTGTYPSYSYAVDNVKIENGDKFMYWSGNQSLTISSGEGSATITDDIYSISGSAFGITYAGNDYSTTSGIDLTLLGNCEWISSGTVEVTPENKTTRILDFGSSCDDKAIVKVYSTEQEIVIP